MPDKPRAKLGVIIVEDEERARRTLRDLVLADAEMELLAETAGTEAPAVIERLEPDILLLDVQMPEMDGFEVLRRIAKVGLPVVIFVTAYDRYALDAFEFAAVDYLLKPFTDERFATALQRGKAQARLQERGAGDIVQRLERLLETTAARRPPERLLLRDGPRTVFVSPQEIDWVQADGVYVRLHWGKRSMLVRESLGAMEARLADSGFFRIHRSALVNVARVVELKHRSHGDYAVRLRDGTELTLSRTRREGLEARLQG